MDNNVKLGFFEALFASLIILLSHLILILPKILIQSQGSSSILNIVFIGILSIFITFIFTLLYRKFNGMDLLEISDFLFGKPFKILIGIIYILYMLFFMSLLLRNTAENLRTMYFQSTPTPYLMFFILLAITFVVRKGLKTILRCNLIIVPLIIITLVILFALSSSNFVYERIFPILGHGAKNTFLYGAANISCYSNLVLLYFLMPLLKNQNQFAKLSMLSSVFSTILLLLVVSGLLMVFPISISSGSNIPVYLQTKTITLGRLIQRVDAFFILIWIFNILSYISVGIGFICLIFQKIFNIKDTVTVSYTFTGILFGICLLYKNLIQIRKLDTQVYKILPIIITIVLGFSILFLANIKKYIKNKKLKGVNRLD